MSESNPKTLEYYFDFSSPYGYFGTLFVEQLAKDIGRELVWKPYLMGAAMKVTGLPTLVEIPLKRDYMFIDLKRMSKLFGVRLQTPQGFPFMSVAVCRAFYALDATDPAMAATWCKAAAKTAWEDGKNLSDMQVLVQLAQDVGLDPAVLTDRIQAQDVKDRLRFETDNAVKRGLWGSPHFVIDGDQPYWGCDKRHEIREAYANNS